jgi:hypothetical protein
MGIWGLSSTAPIFCGLTDQFFLFHYLWFRIGSALSFWLKRTFQCGVLRNIRRLYTDRRVRSHETSTDGGTGVNRKMSDRGNLSGCQTASRDALAGEEALEEGGGDMALLEVGVVEDTFVQRDGRFDAFDHVLVEGSAHAGDGFLPVSSMRDDFGDH